MKGQMSIQIDEGEPFIPEKVLYCGYDFCFEEVTRPEDPVRGFEPVSHVVITHYIYQGLEYKLHYKSGQWGIGEDKLPRLHVTGLLTQKQERLLA